MTTTPTWQTLSAAHRERQKRAIPSEWTLEPHRVEQLKHVGTPVEGRLIEADVVRESGLLTEAELAITQDYTAVELLKKISSRDLTSLQVIEAFGKRAALAQQLASYKLRLRFFEWA
jgi:amidase